MFFIELIEMFPILLNRTYNIDMQLKHRRRGEKKEKKQRDKNTEKNKQREKKKEGIEMQKIQYTEKIAVDPQLQTSTANPIVVDVNVVNNQTNRRNELRQLAAERIETLAGSRRIVSVEEYIEVVKAIMEEDDYFELQPLPLANMNVPRDEWLKIRKHGLDYDDPSSPNYTPYSIGGSSVGALMGLSPFKSPEMVKAELQDREIQEEKNRNTEVMEAGHLAEIQLADYLDAEIEKVNNLKSGQFTRGYLREFSQQFINVMEAMKMEDVAKSYMNKYIYKFKPYGDMKVVEDETLYQHPVFPVFNGNIDRFLQKSDGSYDVLEIKSTSPFNWDTQRQWREKAIPSH